jgi:hypothetical protein
MHHSKTNLLILLFLLAIGSFACSLFQTEPDAISFVTFKLDNSWTTIESSTSGAVYHSGSDTTVISIGTGTDEIQLRIELHGAPTGVRTQNEGAKLSISRDSPLLLGEAAVLTAGSSCTINVSKFGNVNEDITGSFSGVLVWPGQPTHIISEGSFQARRMANKP